jgi:imidazoleglycerol-phosphate dehydratase
MRTYKIDRSTKETKISLELNIDGKGIHSIDTGVGFLNHMLELLSVHSSFDIKVKCDGDVNVDFHHSVEDIGICLGQAFKNALGDKCGIARFADRVVPMDECAVMAAIDISGRPFLNYEADLKGKIGDFDAELVEEFLRAFVINSGINMYIKVLKGGNLHHMSEGIFKSLAKCLFDAVKIVSDKIPSSKGVL